MKAEVGYAVEQFLNETTFQLVGLFSTPVDANLNFCEIRSTNTVHPVKPIRPPNIGVLFVEIH